MRAGMMRIAEISLPAIRHNVRHIREITGGAAVIAVIKANGYGHGMEIVGRAALDGGASILAVADLDEAMHLREVGIDAPVLYWLHGARTDMRLSVQANIEIGVNTIDQLDAVALAARDVGRCATVHVKVDTGLSRNGAAENAWPVLFERAAAYERAGSIRVKGIFSHLANAGEERDRAQAATFERAIRMLEDAGVTPELRHLAASAATLTSPHLHYNAVRVGLAVMGLSPFPERTPADLGLRPAMTLKSEIVALRNVPAGTGVSYEFTYHCETDTTLALVPIGYADGMPFVIDGSGAMVTIRGVQCPIVGRIGMDQCIVDLAALGSDLSEVALGEPVTLFGDPERGATSVDVWADLMQTINYEIIVGIGARVNRVPVGSPEPE